jgi:hypothetical protein
MVKESVCLWILFMAMTGLRGKIKKTEYPGEVTDERSM